MYERCITDLQAPNSPATRRAEMSNARNKGFNMTEYEGKTGLMSVAERSYACI